MKVILNQEQRRHLRGTVWYASARLNDEMRYLCNVLGRELGIIKTLYRKGQRIRDGLEYFLRDFPVRR